MTLRPSDLAGLLVAALLLLWLAFSAGRGCAPTRAPKPQTLPEIKAQRATEQDVHEMRERLAAEDAEDAAKWQAQIDEAAAPPADGDPDTQLLALAALARQAKARSKR